MSGDLIRDSSPPFHGRAPSRSVFWGRLVRITAVKVVDKLFDIPEVVSRFVGGLIITYPFDCVS